MAFGEKPSIALAVQQVLGGKNLFLQVLKRVLEVILGVFDKRPVKLVLD